MSIPLYGIFEVWYAPAMRRSERSYSPEFGQFVRRRREALGHRPIEFALRAGISPAYLSQIEHGLVPGRERVEAMANALGEIVSDWLAAAGAVESLPSHAPAPPESEVSGPYTPVPSDAKLPVLGTLRAGEVVMAEEEHAEFMPCLAEHAAVADFVVRVEGWSMVPKLEPGDFIAVKRGRVPIPGDIVVAKRDDTIYIKRFVRRTKEGPLLRSDNPEYGEIQGRDISILGVVVWKHSPLESLRQKV
jgi:phage repressor protein C with HTH and peptisase S24 domain